MNADSVILQYSHPYIPIFLQDNTIYVDETGREVPVPTFNGIQVGFFEGGRDNTVLYCTSTDQFINECHAPNYKKYGQAAYNIVAALDTNQAGMYIMRLLPKNATYANLTVMVDYKLEEITAMEGEEQIGTGKHRMLIRFRKAVSGGANTIAVLKNKVAELYNDMMDDDGDGWFTAPLFTFWQLGRGEYGNDTKIRFTDPMTYTRTDNDYRTYTVTVMEPTSSGLTEREYLTGSLSDGLLDPTNADNPSLFLEDVANDPELGSGKINMLVHVDTMEMMLSMYNQLIEDEYADTHTPMEMSTFDPIFGLLMSGEVNDLIEVVDNSGDKDYINLVSVSGFDLEGGSDGDLTSTFNKEDIEQEKTNLLLSAFNNEIDQRLRSAHAIPADFCLDANFPDPVKRAMAAFAAKREYSCMTYIDTGLLTTVSEITAWARDFRDIFAFNLVKESGCYSFRDTKYTGKIVPVTTTHFIAKALPRHIGKYEYREPFARGNAVLVKGKDFVSGTFLPNIIPDMHEEEEELAKYCVNYYESSSYGTVQRATGITTCQTNSDRALEFNEYILHQIVDLAYKIMDSKLYKIGEPDDRLRYKTQAEKEILYKFEKYIRSITVDFVMTSKDERRNTMQLVLAVVFKTVITKGVVRITLNPRVTTTSDTTATTAVVM